MVDAAIVGLALMERAYPKEPERLREYRKLAKQSGIPVDEDPELAEERRRAAMAQIEADFGGDL
jgi:hypothetical protein